MSTSQLIAKESFHYLTIISDAKKLKKTKKKKTLFISITQPFVKEILTYATIQHYYITMYN